MHYLRFLLFPFSLLYGCVVVVRNFLYNIGVFKSYKIPGASITLGNLSTGGTGKSPHVNYLVELLSSAYSVSVLSRGYGRKTSGLFEVTKADSTKFGDEPSMYRARYPQLQIVVAEDRKLGVDHIRKTHKNSIILLDDAFQHRKVKSGLQLLITEYQRLFTSDFMLPTGNLREPRFGAKRANAIIVSKCPATISVEERNRIKSSLNHYCKSVYFSRFNYEELQEVESDTSLLLVTGIGNPAPLVEHLSRRHQVEHLRYRDHHPFTEQDLDAIHKKFGSFAAIKKLIVTTEKDYIRLQNMKGFEEHKDLWKVQRITVEFEEEKEFKSYIANYASQN